VQPLMWHSRNTVLRVCLMLVNPSITLWSSITAHSATKLGCYQLHVV